MCFFLQEEVDVFSDVLSEKLQNLFGVFAVTGRGLSCAEQTWSCPGKRWAAGSGMFKSSLWSCFSLSATTNAETSLWRHIASSEQHRLPKSAFRLPSLRLEQTTAAAGQRSVLRWLVQRQLDWRLRRGMHLRKLAFTHIFTTDHPITSTEKYAFMFEW